MEKMIQDKTLGTILIRTSPRATRYTLKIAKGRITATMPPGGNEARLLAFISENRDKLRAALDKHPARPLLNEQTEMQTASFRIHIFRTDRDKYYITFENGILNIACPRQTDFADEQVQKQLNLVIEKMLRHEARRLLPARVKELAARHGFTCTGVKITNSKTRWGSCTQRRSINLSLSLMLLPWHLIDYVLLHELCHTIEMNHGDRFWKLMDRVTDGRAHALRAELKQFRTL